MQKNRFVLTVLTFTIIPIFALAQAPSPSQNPGAPADPNAAANEPPTAEELELDKAIAKVRAVQRVSADISQNVEMLGQKFKVSGTYLKDTNYRIRLQLTLSGLGDAEATLLQVCDGKTLWDYQRVLDNTNQSYSKTEIAPVLKKLDDPILDPAFREQVTAQLGFAGPDALIAGLRKTVKFDQKAEETLDGKAVLVYRGQWKKREGLLAPNAQPLPATVPLPPYIPSNIALYIGKDDGWPYKVEFVGNAPSLLQEDTRRIGPDGRPIGAKTAAPKIDPSKVFLTYSNVKLNPEINPGQFAFQAPPDAKNVSDQTEQIVSGLDQYIQIEKARKKSEASKAESTLPGGVAVPKPVVDPLGPPGGGPGAK